MPRLRLGVALLVPPPADVEVDALRRALGDGMVGRVPPHLTLVPPVNVREDDLADALDVLRSAAAATRPLRVTLGPPATFLPVNPVLYLDVVGDLPGVHAVRDRVFTAPLARSLTWPFVPHVTVLDDGEPSRVEAARTALADYRAEVTFSRVHLLREQRDEAGVRTWRPVADMAFGAPAVVGRGGLELELAVTDRLATDAAEFARRAWASHDVERGRTPAPPARPLAVTARRDGVIVGVADGEVRPGGDEAYLAELIVEPAARGQGIGSHLLASFSDAARRHGASAVVLRTEADAPAVRFYEERGFQRWYDLPSWRRGRDFVQMRRSL